MSVWGVAKPLLLPTVFAPSGDVSCPAATQTTVITSGALVALDASNYYPLIWGVVALLMGATPPSACTIQFILGAGAQVDVYTVPPAALTANATLMVPLMLIGVNSKTNWVSPGSTINVQVNPTGQTITTKQVGSRLLMALFLGPDA